MAFSVTKKKQYDIQILRTNKYFFSFKYWPTNIYFFHNNILY